MFLQRGVACLGCWTAWLLGFCCFFFACAYFRYVVVLCETRLGSVQEVTGTEMNMFEMSRFLCADTFVQAKEQRLKRRCDCILQGAN